MKWKIFDFIKKKPEKEVNPKVNLYEGGGKWEPWQIAQVNNKLGILFSEINTERREDFLQGLKAIEKILAYFIKEDRKGKKIFDFTRHMGGLNPKEEADKMGISEIDAGNARSVWQGKISDKFDNIDKQNESELLFEGIKYFLESKK